jgi:hypothetical protein
MRENKLYFLFSQAANDGMDALKYAARRQQMAMPDINLPTLLTVCSLTQ